MIARLFLFLATAAAAVATPTYQIPFQQRRGETGGMTEILLTPAAGKWLKVAGDLKPSFADIVAGDISNATSIGRTILTAADAAAVRSAIGVSSGGSGSVAAADITDSTATGRALITAANASAARTTLGLGSLATASGIASTGISDSTSIGRTILTATDAAAVRTALSLGSLATASGIASTGISDSTSIGRTILTATDAAAVRTALSLGSLATASGIASTGISDSTATGRSLITAANASAARSTLGLGIYALANTITISDVIDLTTQLAEKSDATHDHTGQDINPQNVEASGQVAGHGLLVRQVGGAAASAFFNPSTLSGERNYDLPDADGMLALRSYVDAAVAGVSGGLPTLSGHAGEWLHNVDGSTAEWASLPDTFPPQTGNTGQYLTTNGSTVQWTVPPYALATDFNDFADAQLTTNAGFASDIAALDLAKAPKGAIGSSGLTMSTGYVLGRTSASTGLIEQLTGSNVLDLLTGTIAQGSVIYRSGTQWAALGAGNAGEVLTAGGAGVNPSWAAGGGLPSMTGNSGKLLTTNGTAASWTTTTAQLDGIGSTRGQILYRGSSTWSALAAGTSGYYLKANGAGADPTWSILPVIATSGGVGYGSVPTGAGSYSLAGGFQPDAPKDMSVALGTYPVGEVYASLHLSGGRFAASGDSETIVSTFRNSTTGNTAMELYANGSSERFTIKANTVANVDIRIVAKQQSSTNCATFCRRATLCRDGSNNTSLVGSVETVGTDVNSPGWSVAVSANDTNEAIKIDVTGASATNIRWTATLIITEVSY